MRDYIVVALVFLFMGIDAAYADTYLELGAGYNTRWFNPSAPKWNDGGSPGFYGALRYEQEFKTFTLVYQYTHYSQ